MQNFDKDRIGNQLLDRVVKALNQGETSHKDLPFISSYILDHIHAIKNGTELVTFLTRLTERWSFFGDMLLAESTSTFVNK